MICTRYVPYKLFSCGSGPHEILVCAKTSSEGADKFIKEIITRANGGQLVMGLVFHVRNLNEPEKETTWFATAPYLEEHGYITREKQ